MRMKKAIVLSGGGALGSYQIGVWKALRKLNLKFDIVTGTSVGSINGAWMVQKEFRRAKKMWESVSFSTVFDENIESNVQSKKGKIQIVKLVLKNLVKNGGLDSSKLENQVEANLNLRKFYNSKMDYGLVTVKLPSMKPVKLTKKEIPRNSLKDYIVASSTMFPVYKIKKIDDISYVDGGYRDNFPIELAIEMGAKEIIAVDVVGISKSELKDFKDVKIVYISPRNDIGSFLAFSSDLAKRNIKLGFNDTMKVFDKYAGNKYTFKKKGFSKNLLKHQSHIRKTIEDVFDLGLKRNIFKEQLFKVTDYYKMLNNDKYFEKTIFSAIEYLAKSYKIDASTVYSMNKFHNLVFKEMDSTNINRLTSIEKKIRTRDVTNVFSSKVIIKYMFEKLNKLDGSKKSKKELSKIAILLPKEFISAVYLFEVNKRRNSLFRY